MAEGQPLQEELQSTTKEAELTQLRQKVESQANLLRQFKSKLLTEKSKNKKIQMDYESKLKLIRKMRI